MKTPSRFYLNRGWKVLMRDIGVDPKEALKLCGLSLDLMTRHNISLPAEDYFALWEVLGRLTDDAPLPLTIGKNISVELFDPPIFACLCSPNLEVALERMKFFKRLIGPMKLELRKQGQSTTVSIQYDHLDEDIPFAISATEIVFFVQLIRLATRHHVIPERVCFTEQTEYQEKYAPFFGIDITQADQFEIQFSSEDVRRPFLTEDASMWDFFEPELRRRLHQLEQGAPVTARVRSLLLEMLPSGLSSMEIIAERLTISKRTLSRRLKSEGESYHNILKTTRKELAEHYLTKSQLSYGEISFLLGFQDTNSFIRAYSSWTGNPPGILRNQLH